MKVEQLVKSWLFNHPYLVLKVTMPAILCIVDMVPVVANLFDNNAKVKKYILFVATDIKFYTKKFGL